MLHFAAGALSRIKDVPPDIWKFIAIGVGILAAIVIVMRKLAGANKIWLTIIGAAAFMMVGFQWIYNRTEPKFLTPVISKIAPFFPSKIDYYQVQKKDTKL